MRFHLPTTGIKHRGRMTQRIIHLRRMSAVPHLGNYSDLRLPTEKELMSIVDYSVPYPGPTIHTAYFPDSYASYYWSSTTVVGVPYRAWSVGFYYGDVYGSYDKNVNYYVRCVRGGQIPSQSFVDNGNGTVTDNRTGLIWQQVSGKYDMGFRSFPLRGAEFGRPR